MAQRSLAFRLPLESESPEPITFMRAPYSIHPLPAVTLTTPNGYSPAQIRHAYGFDQITNQGAGQIIGIIDAYDDPNAESDLAVFDQQFGLPACTTANGCFRKIFGGSKRPKANAGWALEISLDIEWTHAIAPKATILLVEATTNSLGDLLNAVDVAVRNGRLRRLDELDCLGILERVAPGQSLRLDRRHFPRRVRRQRHWRCVSRVVA